MVNTASKKSHNTESGSLDEIVLQPAAFDIWDKKYRLKTMRAITSNAGALEHKSATSPQQARSTVLFQAPFRIRWMVCWPVFTKQD